MPSRVTQQLAEVLSEVPANLRLTQVLAEVLSDIPTILRITQVMAEVLVLDSVGGREASTACLLWRLRLRDGTVLRFTTLDADVTYAEDVYLAAAFDASASEQVRTLAAGQVEVAGLIDSDIISARDIQNGRFDGADVEVLRIDWSDPAAGAEMVTAGRLGAVSTGPLRFEAEALTPSARLDQQVIDTYTPGCRVALFSAKCGIAAAGFTQSHAVTAVGSRAQFSCAIAEASGWAAHGRVTFTGGPNAGAVRQVRAQVGGEITLWEPLAVLPTIGDTFTITAGCNGQLSTCRDKFNNVVNHRGFPTVPGDDAISQYPNAR